MFNDKPRIINHKPRHNIKYGITALSFLRIFRLKKPVLTAAINISGRVPIPNQNIYLADDITEGVLTAPTKAR